MRMSDEEYSSACSDAAAAGLDFGKYVRKLLSDARPAEQRRKQREDRRELERFVALVSTEQKRIQVRVPDVDPHDLSLILSTMLRPVARRRFFLRSRGEMNAF